MQSFLHHICTFSE